VNFNVNGGKDANSVLLSVSSDSRYIQFRAYSVSLQCIVCAFLTTCTGEL